MRLRIVRVEHDSLANPSHGEVMPADLRGDDAEMVQGVGVPGLHGKDLAVERLRLRQPSRLMMLKCQREGLWSGHRGYGEGMTNGE